MIYRKNLIKVQNLFIRSRRTNILKNSGRYLSELYGKLSDYIFLPDMEAPKLYNLPLLRFWPKQFL